MKIEKTKKVKIVDEIICDICGSSCKDANVGNEHASLVAHWGYASRKDESKYDIDFCENCFDKLIKYLKKIRIVKPSPDPLEPKFI